MFDYIIFLLPQVQATPAHVAALHGRVEILRTLRYYGAKLTTKDKVNFV